MDSVKYQKFDASSEHKPKKSSQKSTIALVLVAIALVIFAVAAVAIGVGVGSQTASKESEHEEPSGLSVDTITQEEFQGEYYGSSGGIHFQVIVRNNSYLYLSINTTRGEPVVIIVHVAHSSVTATMMGVSNTEFLVMENQPGRAKYVDYVVPAGYKDLVESMMMDQRDMTDDVLQQLDNETVNETRQSSLEYLAMSQEGLLIIEAAKAIEASEVQGSDYLAVMRFYLLALQLSKTRDFMEGTSSFAAPLDSKATYNSRHKRVEYGQCSPQNGGAVCTNYDNPCPFQRYTNNCFGLCGKGCSCWRFLCGGDCCVHQFCLTHDQCCQDNGFFSSACLSVLFKYRSSRCESNYDC